MKTSGRWARQVYLVEWMLLAVFLHGFFYLAGLTIVWVSESVLDARFVHPARDIVSVILVVHYAGYRALAFHPVLASDYRQWLKQTPWSARQPLPFGRVYLSLHDLWLLLFVRALGSEYTLPETTLPLAFLFGYLTVLTWPLWQTGQRYGAYGQIFLLGGAAWATSHAPVAGLLLLVATYLLAVLSLRRSWLAFPWDAEIRAWDRLRRMLVQINDPKANLNTRRLAEVQSLPSESGWPFRVLYPQRDERFLGNADWLCLSLLGGWLTFVLLAVNPRDFDDRGMGLFLVPAAGILALVRVARYCATHHSPINLWGRLLTLRWIIPRYDCVFIAPLLTVAIGFVGTVLLLTLSHNPLLLAAVAGSTVSALLLITSLLGPDLDRWQLTCPCRISSSVGPYKRAFEEI